MAGQQAEIYLRIYALVEQIPRGRVTTYGQLAAMCGLADARIVGDAMNASSGLAWQRVVNSRGEISLKGTTGRRQRTLLEGEGVTLDEYGRIDLMKFGWTPDPAWLAANGYRTPPPFKADKRDKSSPEGEQPGLF